MGEYRRGMRTRPVTSGGKGERVSALVEEWDPPHGDAVHGGPVGADGVEPDPAHVVQDGPAGSLAALRVDFGAHLEANYQRLVAQLYAITLDAGEAHDAVQDAYSRAWRDWARISRSPDPTGWVRNVAVRSTGRGWRRVLAGLGIGRGKRPVQGADPRTAALLSALARLGLPERRAVVLRHMAGASVEEIAAVEQTDTRTVTARLDAARHVVVEGMADVLSDVLADPGRTPEAAEDHTRADEGDPR